MSYLGAENGRTRGRGYLGELELLRGWGGAGETRTSGEARERRRRKRKRPKGSRGREDAAAAASTAESPRSSSASAAPCAPQPGSAAAPPRLFPPRARPSQARPPSAQGCHRRSVGEGERRAPPPAAASLGTARLWATESPAQTRPRATRGGRDQAPSFLPSGTCTAETVPLGWQSEQQRHAGLLKDDLGKSGTFQSVSLFFPSLYHG